MEARLIKKKIQSSMLSIGAKKMSRIDKSSLLAIVFVAILAISATIFKDFLMQFTRSVLENGHLKIVLLIAVTIIVFSHSIKIKPKNDSSNVMIRSRLAPLDIFLTLGTYIAVTSTACSLLEGAFIQQFFGVKYFNEFESLDIYVLLGVAALLLWYVAFHMYKMFIELLFNTTEVLKSSEEMHKKSMQQPPKTAAD